MSDDEEQSGSEGEEEEEEDEEGSEENSNEGSDEDGSDEEGSDAEKGSEEEKKEPEKKIEIPQYKPSKYQSILTSMKDINKDLDDMFSSVDDIFEKYSPPKRQMPVYQPPPQKPPKQDAFTRTYGEAVQEYSAKKAQVHAPQQRQQQYQQEQQQDGYDDYYGDQDHEINDREYEYPRSVGTQGHQTFGQSRASNKGHEVEIQTQKNYQRTEGQSYQQQPSSVHISNYNPYSQKQVGFTERTQPMQEQQMFQRNPSPIGRFQNQPSGNLKNANTYHSGQNAPTTSYTQFYKNQSSLQQKQAQQLPMQQSFSQPQFTKTAGLGNTAPQFGTQASGQKRNLPPGINEGDVQQIMGLQAAIDALLQ